MTLRIKELAKEKGIRLEEIAKAMGIKQESLSRSINNNPTLETLKGIADALNVGVVDLFERETGRPIYEKVNGEFKCIGYLSEN